MTPSPTPTRARFVVLGLLCSLTFVLYLDRVCISQALVPIQRELQITDVQSSYIFLAFTIAYSLFEVPTGHWGDRIGARAVLTRIAIWWSIFTALTAACTGLYTLLLVRFLFGAGEAGALPNVARIVTRWFPPGERGRVQGLVQTTMVLGGALSPVVAAYIIEYLGWRTAFVVFGGTGVVWAGVFWWWFRDEPGNHPAVNAAELDEIGPGTTTQTHHESIPWKAALTNSSIWLLAGIMVFGAFNSYIYLSWFSTYLQKVRGVHQVEAGWLASLVLGGAAVGMLLGGYLIDRLSRPGQDPVVVRRRIGYTGYLLAAMALTLGLLCDSPRLMSLCAAVSVMATTATLSGWWSCVADVSGRHLGALFGLMNGVGGIGALSSQFFFPALAQWRGNLGYQGREQWDLAFVVCIGVLLLAASSWACFKARPVITDGDAGGESAPS